MRKYLKYTLVGPYSRRGFSLVELTITTLMIAIIAGAIGLALHQAHNRSNSVKLNLAQQQNQNEILSLLRTELPPALQLISFSDTTVRLQIPDLADINNGDPVTVRYSWDDKDLTLKRRDHFNNTEVVSDNVYYFLLEYDNYVSETITYVRGVTVTLQFGPDSQNRFRTFIDFLNHPVKPVS